MNNSENLSVLFVCHGNICRSPMAEFLFRRLVQQSGLSECTVVSSAGISDEESGNPVYPLAKRELAARGIGCRNKRACQLTQQMFDNADYVIAMDSNNINGLLPLTKPVNKGKVFRLMDFVANDNADVIDRDIADPWYTRDFGRAWSDISLGCNAFLDYLKREHPIWNAQAVAV